MHDQLAEPIGQAASTTITVAKIGTPTSAAIAGLAGMAGDNLIALAGLFFTILFGVLGVVVSYYFKHKAHQLAREMAYEELALKRQENTRLAIEHEATMKRLTEPQRNE